MKSKLLSAFILISQIVSATEIIPKPVTRNETEYSFVIDELTSLVYEYGLCDAAAYLLEYVPLRRYSVIPDGTNAVVLKTDGNMAAEEYALNVGTDGVTITGGSYGGVFNGMQTFLQMLPPKIYSKHCRLPLQIKCGDIADKPKFDYRGFSLDVARTWIPADKVKRYIDLLAYHKINKLHFHLTDDEGWRIELKSHPEFAKTGGFRGGDSPVHPRYDKFDEKWGGYYTQEELRSIVEYARVRNIEVIPEIDMPGHSKALGAIRHDILCGYTPDTSISNGLDIRNVWCAAKESNYALIDDIIREVSGIFTSEYIHIGGDEVNMEQWRKCPDCQRLKREKGLANEKQIEDYFIARVTEILARYGKKPAVWNEAIEGGKLPKTSRVHGWQSIRHCKQSTDKGYPTIVMPGEYFYFDMKQSDGEFGHNWAAIFDAKKVLSFDFDKYGFTDAQRKCVAGLEASFFSEIYIAHSPEKSDYLDYMLFPRLCSFSEVAWSDVKRDWDEFYKMLKDSHYDRMQAMGISFRLSTPKVEYADGIMSASVDDGSTLHYTDERTGKTFVYGKPFVCDAPTRIVFHSEYGTARSRDIGSKEYYAEQKPATTVTTSMPCSEKNPIANAAKYSNSIARTTRAAHRGDWIRYDFAEPVSCREIKAQTGHIHLYRCLFLDGHVEISYDGDKFVRAAELHNGGAVIRPEKPVKSVRIVADGNSDAEDNVVIQSLKIK